MNSYYVVKKQFFKLIHYIKHFALSNHLLRGATSSFALKIISTSIALITNILLARLMGKEGLGVYVYALTWVDLLRIPATLGLNQLIVREIAIYKAKELWNEFHGLVQWSSKLILCFSTFLAISAMIISILTGTENNLEITYAIAIALFLLPIKALTIARTSILQGLEQIVKSQLPEYLLAPCLSLVFLGLAFFWADHTLPVNYALISRVLAFYIAFYVGSRWLTKSLPDAVKQSEPKLKIRYWLKSSIPLMFLEGILVVHNQTDLLMLGAIRGPEAVGIYSVLSRGVMLIVFVLGAVNTTLSPSIAKLFALGETAKLQNIIARSARIVLFVSVAIGLLFILGGHHFLLLFGKDFYEGRTALNILAVAKMLGATTTTASFLLTMTGHERHIVKSATVSTLANIILNSLLIPKWGIEGAATATGISSVFLHFWNGYSVWKSTGINPTPFGIIRK